MRKQSRPSPLPRFLGFVLLLTLALSVDGLVLRPAEPAHARVPNYSNALAGNVANPDFSGTGLGIVAGAPNGNFEATSMPTGAAPLNYNFATGDLTNWPVQNGYVAAGGPSGSNRVVFLDGMGAFGPLTSSVFQLSPTSYPKALTLQYRNDNSYGTPFQFGVRVGGSIPFNPILETYGQCSGCTDWTTLRIELPSYLGDSVWISVQPGKGQMSFANIGVEMTPLLPYWTMGSGAYSLERGGPFGQYLRTSTSASIGVSIPDSAQILTVDTRMVGQGNSYTISVTSAGTTYPLFAGNQTNSSTWGTRTFSIGDIPRGYATLTITPAAGSTVEIDNAGVVSNVVGGWNPRGTAPLTMGNENGINFVSGVGTLDSTDLTADYPSSGRTWFRVCYRPKAAGTSLVVSKLNTAGSSVEAWTAPVGALNTWQDAYVSFTSTGGMKRVRIDGMASSGTRPDLGCLERVDGSSQSRFLASPLARSGALPPDLAQRQVTTMVGGGVEPISGNFSLVRTDLAIPGLGVPLSFVRSYSSQATPLTPGSTGQMGAKWSHNWQMSVRDTGAGVAFVRLPSGANEAFYGYSGAFTPSPGLEGSLVKNGNGTWTLTTKGLLVYLFDSAGKWTSVADRNNNVTTLAYDGFGRLSTVTESAGRALTLTYDASGRVAAVGDGLGRTASYSYSASGDLWVAWNVVGGLEQYAYSGSRLTQATDARGVMVIQNTYDLQGRVISQIDAAGGAVTISANSPTVNGSVRVTNQRTKATTLFYDAQMRITDAKDHNGNLFTIAYDADNNQTSAVNQTDKTWSFSYDSTGNQLGAVDPLAASATKTYTAKNDPAMQVDPLTKVTQLAYTPAGNVSAVIDPANKQTTFTYNTKGQPLTATDPLGHVTSYGYDVYGNQTTVTNALGKSSSRIFDSKGRLLSATDALGNTSTATYNNRNQVLTATNALAKTTTFTYDAVGNLLTQTDANSKTTSYTYNSRNLVATSTDAAGGVWSFGYDAVGNLTSKTNPRAQTTTYVYDSLNRLTSESNPLGRVWSYAYNATGTLSSRTDAKGQTITYTYNARNELTNITYPNATFVSYAYNAAGAMTQMVDGTGTTTYAYDNLYRLTSVTFPGARTVSYLYDDASRRTRITYPGGTNQVNYAYDNANRLTSVTDWNANTTSYAYDDANRMTTTTLPTSTGVVSSYGYNNANQLMSIAHVKGVTTLASASYTLDNVGNRTQRVDQQGTHTYAYDNLYRLTSATYPGPSTTSYAFDAGGNRTSMTAPGGTTSYTYNNADQVTSYTSPATGLVSYTWDNNGNLTQRGPDTFAWDYENRLTSATVAGVATTVAYRGDGLRDNRTTAGVTTTFTWDLAGGLPVVLDDGSKYVYGAGLISQTSGANTYYYLSDGLGSTMKTVDATGTVVNGYTYDVYGKKTSSTGSQPNEFDFAGQQTDATGLQYLRARYYDPVTGTFLSRDPMAARPSWTQSPYGYAGGNPVNASDPTGLWCKICGSVAKYAASVAADSAAAVGSAVVSGIRASGDAQATSLAEQAAAANAAASSAASSAAACAGDEYCRALVIGGTYAAGIALSAFAPTAGAGAALIVIATAAATASDLNDCLGGSNLGCGMLALDAATLGAASIEGSGIRAGASAGQAPWEAMLQRPSAAVANWSVHTAASGGAEAAQQIWSAIYSTGKWANDGFGDGW